jgi:hypothetical protein
MPELMTTGAGSIWQKTQRKMKTCPRCGSTNIIYKEKFYANCFDCNLKFSRKQKNLGEGLKIKPLVFDTEAEQVIFHGRMVGVRRIYTYTSHRDRTHFVKKYVGFGLSVGVMLYLKEKNVKEIVIIYTKVDGTQEVFYSTMHDWDKNAVKDSLGEFEEQLFLPLKFFRR